MYGCESWIVKKADRWRIDAFKLWCWRRLLRVPWTAKRSNQTSLKISPGISLEEMMLKLKLQFIGHLMRRVDLLILIDTYWYWLWYWEGLGAGGEGDDRGWDGWMALLTQWTWVWVNSGSWWWTGRPGVLRFMGSQRVGQDWETELNWTETWTVNRVFCLEGTTQHKTVLNLKELTGSEGWCINSQISPKCLVLFYKLQQNQRTQIVWELEGNRAGSAGKESACNAWDEGSIPGLGRSLQKEMATCSSIIA